MPPMLQQEKCLETLTQQNQQILATQSTKRPSDDVAPAVAAVLDKKQNHFGENLTACNYATHTAWQHVAANRENQQRKQQVNTGDNNFSTDIGITAKCALNAASKQTNTATNVSSNITNRTTLLSQQSKPNVACGKYLKFINQSNSKHLTPFPATTPRVEGKQCSKLFSNMLQQHDTLTLSEPKPKIHTNYARRVDEEQCAMISIAAINATTCQNTTTTTTTTATAKTKTENVVEIFEASPPTPVQPSLNQQNKEKTIDFNSRRRRGRLRPPLPPPTPPPSTSPKHERVAGGGVGFHSADCLGRGVTATVCRALMWLASYLEKVAYNRANAGYDQSDPLLYLLSVLLSLIVVNVNRVAIVVNEFKNEVNKNAITNTNKTNKITTNTTLTTASTNITNRETSEINKNRSVIKSVAKREENFIRVGQQLRCDSVAADVCESAACDAERQEAVKAKNNNNLYAQNNITTPAADAAAAVEQSNYEPNTTMTATTTTNSSDETSLPAVGAASGIAVNPQQAANTNNINNTTTTTTITTITTNITPTTTTINNRKTFASIPWRCRQMHLLFFYAFILCTSILLPCGNNLVSAAKPKSATQLQQQKQLLLQQQQQQQQQEQQQYEQHVHGQQHGQHGHQAHQPAAGPNGGFGTHGGYAGLGIPVAAGGPGADLTPPTYQVVSSQTSNEEAEFIFPSDQSDEQIFDQEEQNLNVVEMDEDDDDEAEDRQGRAYDVHNNETAHPNVTKAPLFPKDLFTKEQLENGAVICHIIGVIYMFVALAIVCDEFFVPSLDVIIEKLDITDDVAGATFMAAGGSAPELFTSVIGVFISFDDVGIGTIVGSAVFNILFVIGMCALFSKTILELTWWPLFRDCTFYSLSLMVLIYFFRDNFIYWWEALILFGIYIAYVTFMKWNVQVERFVKRLVTKNKVTRVRSTDQLMPAGNAANSSETSMATQPGGSVTSRAASETRSGPPGSSSGAGATGNSSGGTAGSTHTGAKFRHGLLQLMIHTIDPLHDGKVDEKATQLHAIASLKVLLDATKPQRGGATTSAANHVKINLKETTLADRPNGNIDTTLDSANEIEDEPEPLSMAWPDTARKRLTYILVAPLLIPMWLTLPDTRTPRGKKYYPVTFIGSIVWIAAFSYLMVWWANVAGDTARIPPEVMGLTFLAAGTSIPDLITSVIVARKGFGDMAVSSSVGSNIFDVTVGLPIPWLIYGIIYDAPVEVNSVGMVCSITILFMMLIFVVMSIACFRWKMNRGLGFTMFLLYFVFVAVSLMFEYDTLQCPV